MTDPNTSKVEIYDGITYQYSTSWIYSLESEDHWRLYWQQQKLINGQIKANEHVLEIGHGTGFTSNYLRSKGVHVTTMDIDPEKGPDIVANVVNFNWQDLKFDHILGFQIFEHIPYVEFSKVLSKLSSVCSKNLFLSVPRCEINLLHLEVRLPKIGHRTIRISAKRNRIATKHHFWEIGNNVSYKTLLNLFKNNNFGLIKKYEKFSRIFLSMKQLQQ